LAASLIGIKCKGDQGIVTNEGTSDTKGFTNILSAAFSLANPKSTKKTDSFTVFLSLLGSASVNAAC